MTTYEKLIAELGEGLGIDLSPDSAGFTEIVAENRVLTIRADENGENEVLVFTTVATAPEDGFTPDTLKRALKASLFGREVVGHHLGIFADSLILSATLPLANLTSEEFADRLLLLARVAGQLAESLGAPTPTSESDPFALSFGGDVLQV